MKVLFINTNDTGGGAARAAMRIMRGVEQYGVEAQMFVKNKQSQTTDVVALSQFVPSNMLYRVIDRISHKIKNKWQHSKWRPYKRTKQNVYLSDLRSTSIHGALQKLDYDILHLHWINNRFLDLDELKRVNKPIVWTLHDSWPFCGVCHVPYACKYYESHCSKCPTLGSDKEWDLAYEVFEKKQKVYKDLDLHIVTPSKWLCDCAKKSALMGQFPIHIIPNCIDTEWYKPLDKNNARVQLGLDTNKKYLLFGAMQATEDVNKGFAYLKQALKQVPNIDIELLMYGTNDDINKQNLSLPARVLGYINNDKMMALLYNAADITIVPSLSENLSNTIMESMACGTPVVAFNIGGNSDMIDHKQNGYLAAEKDCTDLANGIKWCMDNNKDGELGCAAREKVMNNYAMPRVAEQYRKLYDSLL